MQQGLSWGSEAKRGRKRVVGGDWGPRRGRRKGRSRTVGWGEGEDEVVTWVSNDK